MQQKPLLWTAVSPGLLLNGIYLPCTHQASTKRDVQMTNHMETDIHTIVAKSHCKNVAVQSHGFKIFFRSYDNTSICMVSKGTARIYSAIAASDHKRCIWCRSHGTQSGVTIVDSPSSEMTNLNIPQSLIFTILSDRIFILLCDFDKQFDDKAVWFCYLFLLSMIFII